MAGFGGGPEPEGDTFVVAGSDAVADVDKSAVVGFGEDDGSGEERLACRFEAETFFFITGGGGFFDATSSTVAAVAAPAG